ncbi:MAG: hypothetical protein AAFR33_15295 [Pseudomonadota bacterium]
MDKYCAMKGVGPFAGLVSGAGVAESGMGVGVRVCRPNEKHLE